MNEMYAYLLFIKMYNKALQQHSSLYLERNEQLSSEEKKTLTQLIHSFFHFVATHFKQQHMNEDALLYWSQLNRQSVPIHKLHYFPIVVTYAITEILEKSDVVQKNVIIRVNEQLITKSMHSFHYWHEQPLAKTYSNEQYAKMDELNIALIELHGYEQLPHLLIKIEEIFSFKRTMYFSYNPTLKQFAGVIGEEMDKVVRMQGNIELEPVFNAKKPVYLHTPSPYVQPVAIELFQLSSIIFLPVTYQHILYGWLSLDQKGQSFECSDETLQYYAQIGERLGMYLSRKQHGSSINYSIPFSEKERMILHLIAEGYSNKQIATLLFLSEFTIRDYVKQLMLKLNAKNRTHLISIAFRLGEVE